MHRLAAIPGGWNPDNEGVIFLEQTPAPIIMITAADTDIQTLAATLSFLPEGFPALRVANLLQLQQQISIDNYAESVLTKAQIIILRLLGGRAYWSYGLEVVKETVSITGAHLLIIPGDDRPDTELFSHSNLPLAIVDRLWRYFTEGGTDNFLNGLLYISDTCLDTAYHPPAPQVVPRWGIYRDFLSEHLFYQEELSPILSPVSDTGVFQSGDTGISGDTGGCEGINSKQIQSVGLIFYRAHYLSGNLAPIDALCQALIERGIYPIPLFVSSLRDKEVQRELLNYCAKHPIELLINTTSFAINEVGKEEQNQFWQQLDVPVLQVILSSGTQGQWEEGFQGLNPRDVAMNVALPEIDGKIITRAVSFKAVETWNQQLETDVVVYQPHLDRINFVADLAANWLTLRKTLPAERKIALILANYPNKDGRIANGVGLDTPASCIAILKALEKAGYSLTDIPADGDELIRRLTATVTNDLESREWRKVNQYLERETYQQYFETLPAKVRTEINERWSNIVESEETIPIPGIQLGNVFVGIQPSRGYDLELSLNYHAPDLEPTPTYLAYYFWLKKVFNAHALIHVGKHGNLEWLPGKSLALAAECYPEIAQGSIPNIYPFIVNDPGEGSQAKRRSHAVIIDHLTPPLTRAELYGDLAKLEGLIDEYYEAQTLDTTRLKAISARILQLFQETNLYQDLGIKLDAIESEGEGFLQSRKGAKEDFLSQRRKVFDSESISQLLTLTDSYLCQLKEAQIRDGLHIFGQCPQGQQFIDLVISIARHPSHQRLGFTQAIAQDLGWDFNPLTDAPSLPFPIPGLSLSINGEVYQPRTIGDGIEILEKLAQQLLQNPTHAPGKATQEQLQWITESLIPNLEKTSQEITYLLHSLDGKYVPSGSSGAPTRGRTDVLPTGRNFYSIDIRAIPTETAWDVGRKAAEALVERYTQEYGEYPKTLAISIWGTSTMRTGGEDIAQVLALQGIQPVWDSTSRRVVGFEVLSPSVLGRPRIDTTVRVSGFFRDSFPNILQLLYNVTKQIASLKEEKEINPLAAQVIVETEFWENQGLTNAQAKERATYRIFGSKPGAYGAGLQGLIEAQNWRDDGDLAQAYINWSSYAYSFAQNIEKTVSVPEVFAQRLKQLQIVLHNQDNREHDLLDSDDYYQFQGGLTVAVRSLTGKNPVTYFGDNSIPANPKVRLLKEEIAKVYRSRVVNPKWIQGVMRHGYKGAFEMAATVDYLFAYDATAHCVEDFMYQGVADAYIFDEKVQKFITEKNPWALRDMAERLLEAHQRNLWQSPDNHTLEKLRAIVNETEGIIEGINN